MQSKHTSRIKSSLIPKRKVTRLEAAKLTKAIRLGNDARFLKEEITAKGERVVLYGIESGEIACKSADEILSTVGQKSLIDHLDELQEDGKAAFAEIVERTSALAKWVVTFVKAPMTYEQRQDAIGDAYEIITEVLKEAEYDYRKSSLSNYIKVVTLPKLHERLNESGIIKVPSSHIRVKIKLEDECTKFYQSNMREATYEEQCLMLPDIMASLGIDPRNNYTVEDVAFYRGIQPATSLNEPIGEDGDELGDFQAAKAVLANEENYQAAFEALRAKVNEGLGKISERDREIILERSLENEYRPTLEQLGDKYGITKARVQQIVGPDDNVKKSEARNKILKHHDVIDDIRTAYARTVESRELTY